MRESNAWRRRIAWVMACAFAHTDGHAVRILGPMTVLIKELSRFEQPALEHHFLALEGEDRRLRFGVGLNDFAVRAYVKGINFRRDALFGVLDDKLRVIGAALLGRAHTHARNWGVHALFMHCLTENGAMMHLARKHRMEIVAETGEADAWLKLPPADASSYMSAVFEQGVALFDYALKSQLADARRIADALRSSWSSLPVARK